MENQSYFPGQKLKLKIDNQVSKWEVLSVDNTRGMITCQKLNCLDTIVETFAMDRIPKIEIKKTVGFIGAFIFGTFYWTCFLAIALRAFK
ncbi:hypothetical protein [uncultured Clostridium sp.]|uniref:hypothetical protein n=1 Tax=uncultured Clostridium sp. TaxID=59620 RepID=UPI0028EFB6A4|nr:hypothetical protein [uncultured Clostridium sp.]